MTRFRKGAGERRANLARQRAARELLLDGSDWLSVIN